MKTKPFQALIIVFCLSLFPGRAFGQDSTAIRSVFDYLTQEEGGTILLELNLDSLMGNRRNADYLPATITDESGKSFALEVRTRGKFRRKRCEIPPIKLKFQKDSLKAQHLGSMNEIKLVLPCADRAVNDELIMREYIAYRMYETLNPEFCTRARLIRLNLKHINKKRPKKMYGLLVEHEEQVSERTDCLVEQSWGIKPEQLNADYAALMVLFQYMIGNTDWEIVSCRNIMLLQPSDSAKIIPVPYDFDFSGLVSAPYASPSAESGLATIHDRFLMAEGMDKTAIQKARKTILDAKEDLYNWCRSPVLTNASSDQMIFFLDAFFNTLEANDEIPETLVLSKK